MEITVNGQKMEAPEGATVFSLLKTLGVDPRRTVVERNGEIVPREAQESAALSAGDKVELVRFVGGG